MAYHVLKATWKSESSRNTNLITTRFTISSYIYIYIYIYVRNKVWLECVKFGQWKGYLKCVKWRSIFIIVLIIETLSHEHYKHFKVLYICEIALLLLYTFKRYQKDRGWPLEYKSLSIYISCFLLCFIYFYYFTTRYKHESLPNFKRKL